MFWISRYSHSYKVTFTGAAGGASFIKSLLDGANCFLRYCVK